MTAEERAKALCEDLAKRGMLRADWTTGLVATDVARAIRAAEDEAVSRALLASGDEGLRLVRAWKADIGHMHDAIRLLERDMEHLLENGPPDYLIPPESGEVKREARRLTAARLVALRDRMRRIRAARSLKSGGSR